MTRQIILYIFLLLSAGLYAQKGFKEYTDELNKNGREPISFVNSILDKHPLVVFDDALHSAHDPFVFYQQLIAHQPIAEKLDYIFIEVFPINVQPYIDSFFLAEKKDSTLLLKAFQDDYSGYGWKYQTYMDLLSAIRDARDLSGNKSKLKVIAVSPPIYWEAMHTRKDYELFQQSLTARDYFMYTTILNHLHQFKKGERGIFLTNTRHAYKHIKNAEGNLYRNTMTFFDQWHKDKAYSVRLHNVFLSRERKKENSSGKRTTEGLSEYVYTWVLPDGARWDSAYNSVTDQPLALPLHNTIFGRSPYLGNHAPDVQKNTTMYDAYDAVIFLRPSHQLLFSARMSFIYTPAFRQELKRRMQLLEGGDLQQTLKQQKASSLEEYIERIAAYEPVSKNTLVPQQ